MAQDAGDRDIGKLTLRVDSSGVIYATKRLEKLLAIVKELERDYGIDVSTITMKVEAKAR